MEDEEGYLVFESSRQNFCPVPPPKKIHDLSRLHAHGCTAPRTQCADFGFNNGNACPARMTPITPSPIYLSDGYAGRWKGSSTGCKITVGILLALSIAVNVALVTLQLVFQEKDTSPSTSENPCELIPSISADCMTFDSNTAHPQIVVSSDGKTAQWGRQEQQLPNSAQRFNQMTWVLGRNGFLSGKHCWEVEIKGGGDWAVGVAKESVKRKGVIKYSTHEGILGIGQYWKEENYVAFTVPHKDLSFDKKPERIWVFLDYNSSKVELFDAITKILKYTFNSTSFFGEKIFPWFWMYGGTELKLRP